MLGKALFGLILSALCAYIGFKSSVIRDFYFRAVHDSPVVGQYLHRLDKYFSHNIDAQKISSPGNIFSREEVEVHIQNIIDAWNELIVTPEHCLNSKDVKDAVEKRGSTGTERLFTNIVVGVNANIDLIVVGTKFLHELNIKPGPAKDHQQIFSIDQLQQVFHHFLRKGAAAERPFMNAQAYKDMILRWKNQTGEEHQEYIGGNAALMAYNIMSYSDIKVTLVGPVGPKLKDLLTSKVHVPEFSQFEEDEVHLIMEYLKREAWGPSVAPSANRFITSHDTSNGNLVLLDLFFNIVGDGKFDLVILSGLHLLDSLPVDYGRSRLNLISDRLEAGPSWRPVHLELASMTNGEFVQNMAQKIFPKVASLGLNEQELKLLSQVAGGPHQKLKTDGKLDIQKVGDVVHWLLKKYGKEKYSRLTRIHFHTLSFHLTAVSQKWSNQISATGAGARIAGLKACSMTRLNPKYFGLKVDLSRKFRLHSQAELIDFDSRKPIISWFHDGIELIFSPVLVCKKPVKTVGLGDAISSTGLVYSTFRS